MKPISNNDTSFLGTGEKVANKKFGIKLFDESDTFLLKTVVMQFHGSSSKSASVGFSWVFSFMTWKEI